VRSGSADVFYKCDELYRPRDEIVIRWNDPAIAIIWGIESPAMSARDAGAPLLTDVKGLPIYGSV
jgi:dTDP-4-dehydrorhamnose 3,5-epimerase